MYFFLISLITVEILHLFAWLFDLHLAPSLDLQEEETINILFTTISPVHNIAPAMLWVLSEYVLRWVTQLEPRSETPDSQSSAPSTLPLWGWSPVLPEGPPLIPLVLGSHLYSPFIHSSFIQPILSGYSVQGDGFIMLNTLCCSGGHRHWTIMIQFLT